MKYLGSKRRIAKELLEIILPFRRPGQTWVEPFVGGGNMIEHVGGPRIGADANYWVIQALTSIRDHVDDLPRNNIEFTEADYQALKTSDVYPHKGYASFSFSFGAKYLGGWARSKSVKRDYVAEAYRNSLTQSPKLQGVELIHSKYQDLKIPPHSLIYCDPPYANTTKYATDAFDHALFWQWCRDKSIEGHLVFVSEYSTPDDFVPIWEKKISSRLGKESTSRKATEKLFVPQSFLTL